jgi:hypothetical protein
MTCCPDKRAVNTWDDDSSSLVTLRRRGLALAVVRDPRDHRAPTNEEDLADFEADLAAPVEIGRIADAAILTRPISCWPGTAESQPVLYRQAPRPATGGRLPADQSHRAGMKADFGATSIDSITLGDGPVRENAH